MIRPEAVLEAIGAAVLRPARCHLN